MTPTALALATWAGLQCAGALAQALPAEAPPKLKDSPLLQEKLLPADRQALPTFIQGDHVQGRADSHTVVQGGAVLRRGDMVIRADEMEYFQSDDLARAKGNVRINRAGNVYEGPLLELKVDAFEGYFAEPRYYFLANDTQGQARRIEFLDESRAIIRDATYTSCKRKAGPDWLPDWVLRATTVHIDNDEDVGQAQGAVLSFKGLPVLPIPAISFPLSDKRKSGFLSPEFGLNNVSGTEIAVPYYWNIAPNRDATLTPTVMTARGVGLGSEFRYLEPTYSGQLRLDFMPDDKLRGMNRWGASVSHQARLGLGLPGGAAFGLNLNRVGDDDYWRDFSRSSPALTQRLLPNDASLAWSHGAVSASVRTLKWQTLQDVSAPITPPYDRLPQLNLRYAPPRLHGFDYTLEADYTDFQADRTRTGQPNARRAWTLLQVARPWLMPAGFVKPKLQLHATQYEFDAPLASGAQAATRAVPTLSLDGGLVFERDTRYFGRNFLQTLEPRAFFVSTPYRDQSLLPNYDSGAWDFNFASIYTENAFAGNDRVADNRLLTLGVSSRLLDPATGVETARFEVAQRLRFEDQNVTLPGGLPARQGLSDVLLGSSVNWNSRWTLDTTVQFNPRTEQSERATIGARYSPGNYRVISAAYRFQRTLSEQIDVGWQWPINDLWGDRGQELGQGRGQGEGRWYSVGRLNYSLKDGRLVDSVLGFEYDAGCWLGRVVLERLQTGLSSANQRIMFQIEFVGFSRLGVSPLKSLKENIPRYQYLREQTRAPSRFSNYD